MRKTPRHFIDELSAHLATRIVFTGAGGFDNCWPDLAFLLSPRAPHIFTVAGDASTYDRPLVHLRDKPLAGRGRKRCAVVALADCTSCKCDVDRSGEVTTADALSFLKRTVGFHIDLDCPSCDADSQ